jgi:flagellar FliL protein
LAENETQVENTKVSGKKKGKMKLILIPAVLILLLGMGAVAAKMGLLPIPGLALTKGDATKNEESQTPPLESSIGFLYPMNPFIVNLVDDQGGRFLKVRFEMELSDKELVSEVEKRMAQLTDSVIMLLSSKSYHEIASYEGKEQMRHELVIRMNSFLETGSIERLYFTEFVMQ